MPGPSFSRALSLSIRVLAASCSAAIATGGALTLPGCYTRCYEYGTDVVLTTEVSGTDATLRGVAHDYAALTIAVGDGGVIVVRGVDGGWSARTSGTGADLLAVASVSATATAVGAGGVIVRSEDSGE